MLTDRRRRSQLGTRRAPGQLQPAAAQAFNTAANDVVLTSAAGWFIFSVASGLVIIRSRALPSWLGWLSFVIADHRLTTGGL
jgi:hypothetical protein